MPLSANEYIPGEFKSSVRREQDKRYLSINKI